LIDFMMLCGSIGHADSTRDWQAIRMIGNSEARVAEFETRIGKRRDRFATIAPGRMHLKVTAVVGASDYGFTERRSERALHGKVTQVSTSELASRHHLRRSDRLRDRRLN
jgi:hypothetical protein